MYFDPRLWQFTKGARRSLLTLASLLGDHVYLLLFTQIEEARRFVRECKGKNYETGVLETERAP